MSQFADTCTAMSSSDQAMLAKLFKGCIVDGKSNYEIEEAIIHKWKEWISYSHPDNNPSDDSRKLFSFLQSLKGDDKTNTWAKDVRRFLQGDWGLFQIGNIRFDGKDAQCILGLKKSFPGSKIRIPEEIVMIAEGAFWERQKEPCQQKNLELLDMVIIPRSVKVIGENAFRNCEMREVLFEHRPEDELHIHPGAFSGCERLEKINLPLKTTYYVSDTAKSFPIFDKTLIPPDTLGKWPVSWHCCYTNGTPAPLSKLIPDISSITLDGFSEIPDSLFQNLEKLKEVHGIDSVTKIGNKAFFNCISLKRLNIPNTVKIIGDHAFGRCHSLEYIVIPDSVEHIGSRAFAECSSLKACVISRDREFLLPDDAFSDYDYNKRKGLIVHRSRKAEIKHYKKELVCPCGFSQTQVTVKWPLGKDLSGISVSVPSGNLIACIGPWEEGFATVNCFNPESEPIRVCLDVLAHFL